MVDAPQQRMSVEIFRRFYAGRPDEERWGLSMVLPLSWGVQRFRTNVLPAIFSLHSWMRCVIATLC